MSNAVCALVSGGLDSAVLTWRLLQDGSEVQPVYVRTGMRWEPVEEQWLARFMATIASERLRSVVPLSFPMVELYGAHWSVGGAPAPGYQAPDQAVYLPGRNVILLAKTAVYAALNRIERIAMGVLAGNPFPDATDAFFDGMAGSLSAGLDWPIRVERPFATLHKQDVIRLGQGLPLELTFSCISPVGEAHCGNCNKCRERQQAFLRAGVADVTTYARRYHVGPLA